jgi:hypothetical protein
MKTLNICEPDPDEPRLACWLRHIALSLVGLAVLVSLVLSFAVEFMAGGDDFHRRAQRPLETSNLPAAHDTYANGGRPLPPGQ